MGSGSGDVGISVMHALRSESRVNNNGLHACFPPDVRLRVAETQTPACLCLSVGLVKGPGCWYVGCAAGVSSSMQPLLLLVLERLVMGVVHACPVLVGVC